MAGSIDLESDSTDKCLSNTGDMATCYFRPIFSLRHEAWRRGVTLFLSPANAVSGKRCLSKSTLLAFIVWMFFIIVSPIRIEKPMIDCSLIVYPMFGGPLSKREMTVVCRDLLKAF